MEDAQIVLERHEQKLNSLERDVMSLREVQTEIRSMNKALISLAAELKHTNQHLERHERKLEEIDNQPKNRLNQIITALIAAISGGVITYIISLIGG